MIADADNPMQRGVCLWCRQELEIPPAELVQMRCEREMPAEILAALRGAAAGDV